MKGIRRMIYCLLRGGIALCFFVEVTGLSALAAVGSPVKITKMEFQAGAPQDSLSFLTEGKVSYKISSVGGLPPRLVIDIDQAEYAAQKTLETQSTRVKRVRAGQFQDKPTKMARIVLDLKGEVTASAIATEKRLLIVLTDKLTAKSAPSAKKRTAVKKTAPVKKAPATPAVTPPAPVAALTPAVEKTGIETLPDRQAGASSNKEEPLSDPRDPPAPTNPEPAVETAAPKKPPVAERPAETAVAPDNPETTPEAAAPRVATQKMSKDVIKSIRFDEGTDINDILTFFQEYSGINIIASKDVKGKFGPIHLEKVPMDDAFAHVLNLAELVQDQVGPNVIKVYTPAAFTAERNAAITVTEPYELEFGNAAEVAGQISTHLGASGIKVTVTVDLRRNTLLVNTTDAGHQAVREIIENLDKNPEQIFIEAKIVEIVLIDNFDLGITWELLGSRGVGDLSGRPKHAIGKAVAGTVINDLGVTSSVSDAAPFSGTDNTGVTFPISARGGFNYGYVSDRFKFNARVGILMEKTNSRILSQPRIATVNGKNAKIIVGDSIPFLQTTVTATGATQSTSFIQTGIELDVTPNIKTGGRIELVVRPRVSFLRAFLAAGPQISTREASTTVMVKDGQTIVIGGLISDNDRKAIAQLPLLGDLPIFGHLFKSTNTDKDRTELLVFMTPTIIRE